MKIKLLLLILGFSGITFAQNCNGILKGIVIDQTTNLPIKNAVIQIDKTNHKFYSNDNGAFEIIGVCEQGSHITIAHVGCDVQKMFVVPNLKTPLVIQLNHHIQQLEGVVVRGHKTSKHTAQVDLITQNIIDQNASSSLGNMLTQVTGVGAIRNGNGIAKPVVHGLSGSRISILNNGIAQSGQQWGNDHSPEIDPFAAGSIAIIKGVGALEYPGNSLGSVILLNPLPIEQEPHLHGKMNAFFEWNGLGSGYNLQFSQGKQRFLWRVNGTYKKRGDLSTSTYFLNNTGSQEFNGSIDLQGRINAKWFSKLYISTFNTELGLLKGSHIGNLTDLTSALNQDIPFYTEDQFSYQIDAPQQKVGHHFIKLSNQYKNLSGGNLSVTYALQLNDRKEFDVRRGDKKNVPSLSLLQTSHYLETKYVKANYKYGWQFNFVENSNDAATGILPLIPDYYQLENRGFYIYQQTFKKLSIELGSNFTWLYQDVYAISKTYPRVIQRKESNLLNVNAGGGMKYDVTDEFQFSSNLGWSSRNPDINELYSNGLHQGVSGLEEGNLSLEKESSLKFTFGVNNHLSQKVFLSALGFAQYFDGYIFLKPTNEYRLTIRGAFPVFSYEQTNALLYGMELNSNFSFAKNLSVLFSGTYLKGDDVVAKVPLVNMPANNVALELKKQWFEVGKMNNIETSLQVKQTFRQYHLESWQDYVAPPKAYTLLNAKIGGDFKFKNTLNQLYIKAENVLNTTYRDYLNRQRYFANDLGINIVFGYYVKF